MPSRCNGFVRLRPRSEAWARCDNCALPGSRLCARHSAALASVLLGIPELERKLYVLQRSFEALRFHRRNEERRLKEIQARCKGSGVKPGSTDKEQVQLGQKSGPDLAAGEPQVAAKEAAALITALARTTDNSGSFPRKARQRRPRMRLAEAMRARGLDEHLVARVMAMFIRARLKQKKFDKLVVDMVEKVIRVLEPSRPADRGASETTTPVQLIHYVDRPERDNPADEIPGPFES